MACAYDASAQLVKVDDLIKEEGAYFIWDIT